MIQDHDVVFSITFGYLADVAQVMRLIEPIIEPDLAAQHRVAWHSGKGGRL